jgi:hypothetical protein
LRRFSAFLVNKDSMPRPGINPALTIRLHNKGVDMPLGRIHAESLEEMYLEGLVQQSALVG